MRFVQFLFFQTRSNAFEAIQQSAKNKKDTYRRADAGFLRSDELNQ